ncbi:hypothetical protein B0H14DRAFT_2641051 [Mycena olivaceomarginata]|nr:hypothetical protein B0H14DRAFT_2641051 [Mycena olivaceomarginata]
MWPIFGPISGQYLANTTYNGRILMDYFLTTIWPILTQYNMYWSNIGRDLFASNSGAPSSAAVYPTTNLCSRTVIPTISSAKQRARSSMQRATSARILGWERNEQMISEGVRSRNRASRRTAQGHYSSIARSPTWMAVPSSHEREHTYGSTESGCPTHHSLTDVDGCTILARTDAAVAVVESGSLHSTSLHTRKTGPGHTRDEMPAAHRVRLVANARKQELQHYVI